MTLLGDDSLDKLAKHAETTTVEYQLYKHNDCTHWRISCHGHAQERARQAYEVFSEQRIDDLGSKGADIAMRSCGLRIYAAKNKFTVDGHVI